jgi:DNA-binding beta-propeller fold protein YncE
VGHSPRRIAFDGSNVWVTNENDGTVTKLRAIDSVNLGTFPVGLTPQGIASTASTFGSQIMAATLSQNSEL